jgi:hypothetical protein
MDGKITYVPPQEPLTHDAAFFRQAVLVSFQDRIRLCESGILNVRAMRDCLEEADLLLNMVKRHERGEK